MIDYETIENAARQIMANAAIDIPPDYRQGIEDMSKWEKCDLSCFVFLRLSMLHTLPAILVCRHWRRTCLGNVVFYDCFASATPSIAGPGSIA